MSCGGGNGSVSVSSWDLVPEREQPPVELGHPRCISCSVSICIMGKWCCIRGIAYICCATVKVQI